MNELKMCNCHAEALVGHAKSEIVICLVILLKYSVHLIFNPSPLKHNTEMIGGKIYIYIYINKNKKETSHKFICSNDLQ